MANINVILVAVLVSVLSGCFAAAPEEMPSETCEAGFDENAPFELSSDVTEVTVTAGHSVFVPVNVLRSECFEETVSLGVAGFSVPEISSEPSWAEYESGETGIVIDVSAAQGATTEPFTVFARWGGHERSVRMVLTILPTDLDW